MPPLYSHSRADFWALAEIYDGIEHSFQMERFASMGIELCRKIEIKNELK